MLTPLNELPRVGICRTLENRTGHGVNSLVVADATLALWQQVAARLEPVIGAGGVQIVFWRALMVTARKFPWLAAVGVDGDRADEGAMFARFRDALKDRDLIDAAAAGCALLVTLAEILDSLLGEPITELSLKELWSPLSRLQALARSKESG